MVFVTKLRDGDQAIAGGAERLQCKLRVLGVTHRRLPKPLAPPRIVSR